mgnify:CR=1 FL=1
MMFQRSHFTSLREERCIVGITIPPLWMEEKAKIVEKKIHVSLVLSKDMFKFAEKIHFGIIVNLRMGDGGFPMIMKPSSVVI